MARIKELQAPSAVLPSLEKMGIKLRHLKSPEEFEKLLLKFLKTQHVLHLSTCKDDMPRSTPIEFRRSGLTFYLLSEGGKKFINLQANKNVSFSIAAPYDSNKDFWGAKGLQAWGKATVYTRKSNPKKFEEALHKMGIYETIKKMGLTELPKQFNYRIIEIEPDEIRYGHVRAGVFKTTWYRK